MFCAAAMTASAAVTVGFEIYLCLKNTMPDILVALVFCTHRCQCNSVNRYKPLQNRLLQKPLQTVTKSYKPLQTSYSANRYELLQTVKNHYKPFTP